MGIIGTARNVAGGVLGGIGKLVSSSKKPKIAEGKDFLHESPDEYAKRLMQRRSDRH